MCGIFAVISKSQTIDNPVILSHLELVKHRGPDASGSVTLDLENGFFLHMNSYVLHLRGNELVPQPHQHSNGDILQWNGEIFAGFEVKDSESDTLVLANELAKCQSEEALCDVFARLQGPFAFVFYHSFTKKLWFGRDYFGRRSVLYKHCENELVLTSVAKNHAVDDVWQEVPADGLYAIDTQCLNGGIQFESHLWQSITHPTRSKIEILKQYNRNYINPLINAKSDSVGTMIPPLKSFQCDPDAAFSLSNLDNSDSLDILAKISVLPDFSEVCSEFLIKLKEAVRKRVMNVPKKKDSSSSVSVLFSGGIDCTVIALLSDEFVPKDEPINLLNVAFETPNGQSFDVPDRITGRSALKELSFLCPDRNWNFVEVDVTIGELQKMRKIVISDLTYPLVTVLDDSIGCALWFASRGMNGLNANDLDTKVILSGLGADEQLGGYSRHRSAFENGGWGGLENEIKMEIERLSSRNLGRDDRIITDHAKEARFPYLDEEVVSFLNQTPLRYKSNFSFKRGVGEKILLRVAGYALGLRKVAVFPKRAIQFGSRIAKAECRKEKAFDVCNRLL